MSDFFYNPPEGLPFRLFGYARQHVLALRTQYNAEATHSPSEEVQPDQLVTVVHDKDSRRGKYAIKSKDSSKFIQCNASGYPSLGSTDWDCQSEMDGIWFELELDKGDFEGKFRFANKSTDTVVFSRTQHHPQVDDINPIPQPSSDQHLTLLFDAPESVHVVYDLKAGKTIDEAPVIFDTRTIVNKAPVNLSGDTLFKAGIPAIVLGKSQNDVSYNGVWTYDSSNTMRRDLPCGEGASWKEGYKLDLKTKGVWRGPPTWDLRHVFKTVFE
ncbi:unnamed protein product [Peniophora sp. CBMAI 1063]|nr:unnamed protein product [Peniophora sp. CBMAI 1063]